MPRSIWKGSLAFGLVNIPVELYSAVRDHRPTFRLLPAKDIDERYFETPYCLQASKGADRSYALLREAIRESGRSGSPRSSFANGAFEEGRRGERVA